MEKNGRRVFCPKCNGENIRRYQAVEEKPAERVSLDDLASLPNRQTLELRMRRVTVACADCAYEVSVLEPRGV